MGDILELEAGLARIKGVTTQKQTDSSTTHLNDDARQQRLKELLEFEHLSPEETTCSICQCTSNLYYCSITCNIFTIIRHQQQQQPP